MKPWIDLVQLGEEGLHILKMVNFIEDEDHNDMESIMVKVDM